MQATLILIVGTDSSLLRARSVILESMGYTAVPTFSIKMAADNFLTGDFDLVLLDNSLSEKDKDRLTSLIRASGSLRKHRLLAPSHNRKMTIIERHFTV